MSQPEYAVIIYDQKIKDRFLECVDEKTYHKEIIFAKQAFENNDALQKCSTSSIRNAIVNIALTGASLNPALQQAFLIPRKGKCCLDFSYRGLCKIAVDSESVYDIDAVAVFEGDEFDYELGLNPWLKHKPVMHTNEKPEVIAAYAVAILHHGIKKFVVLDKEKIERAKKSAQSGNVWNAHYDEMAKKTAVKLLYKLLPQTEKMSVAVTALNEHEGLVQVTNAEKLQEKFAEPEDVIDVPEVTPDRYPEEPPKLITLEQQTTLNGIIIDKGVDQEKFFKFMGVSALSEIKAKDYKKAIDSLKIAKGTKAA